MAWTSPATWSASSVLTAGQLNTQLRDNMKALGDKTTDVITGNATFTSGVGLTRIGMIVYLNGGFTRASSFNATYSAAGTIPVGFRPAADIDFGVGTFRGTTITYQVQVIAATGVVNIRMSAASSLGMEMGGLCWVAA